MDKMKFLFFLSLFFQIHGTLCQTYKSEIIHKWTKLDFEWPSAHEKDHSLHVKNFIPENCLMTGIKVYRDRVFVTVPRWRLGVPATLNEIVVSANGEKLLRPFPSWEMQEIGNCSAFQYVQSMEIDANTGYMWVIDTGSINTSNRTGRRSPCPAKIVIYDIDGGRVIRTHNFPENVVSRDTNFLNDIVIDYKGGKAVYAYISDAGSVAKIVVYDFEKDESYFFQHSTMESKIPYQVTQKGKTFTSNTPIDGIAMSPDLSQVFFSTITGKDLHVISTDVLRQRGGDFSSNVIEAGIKRSQSDGMIFSQNALYMSSLNTGAVYRRSTADLISVQNDPELFSRIGPEMNWIDTFSIDEHGNLWFTVNNLNLFFSGGMNFSDGAEDNMFIWKVNINEPSYLANALSRTTVNSAPTFYKCPRNYLLLIASLICILI